MSIQHWLLVAVVVLILFGRGRISEMMGDIGKGLKEFKKGMADDTDRPVIAPPAQLPPQPAPVVQPQAAQPAPVDQAGTGGQA